MFNKKIALFISHIYGEYQRNLSQGIIDKALEYGYQTEVYTTNDGEELGGLSITEECILRLPVYSDLSGIIYASGTYSSREFRDKITKTLADSKIPVIEVNDTDPVFPNVTMDNSTMIATITEHFINMHDAKRICYLGCKHEAAISNLRQDIYRKTLIKNNIEYSDADVYICDETKEDYDTALDYFCTSKHKPDAVICYNDRLAYELIIAAENKGYKIPEDFGVSGCDNSDAGQNMIPSLTTISYPVYELGQIAVDNLNSLIKGRNITSTTSAFARVIYGGTCGCSYRSDKRVHMYSHALLGQIADLEKSIIMSSKMSSAFGQIDDIEEGLDIIAEYASQIENCTGFYLALSSNWNNLSERIRTLTDSHLDYAGSDNVSDDSLTMYLAVQNGKRLPGCTFKSNTLLPDYLMSDNENARVVSPVYNHGESYGYIVMTFDNNRIKYPFKLIQWLVNISQLLYNLRNKKRLDAMTTHLEEIYMRDELTGFYNKVGYEYYKGKALEKDTNCEYVELIINLENLRDINEAYGHDEGDFAIQILGQAINQSVDENMTVGRISGAEFDVIIKKDIADNVKKKINSYLDNYARLSSKEYKILANISSVAVVY